MPLAQAFMDELKSRSNLEELASAYTNLKRRGRTLVGLCPFHNEKTPSFTVYPEDNSFYCFGCGAGGDIITFVEKIENLDYMEAVRFLAQRAGLTVPEGEDDRGLSELRRRLYALNREAARFYHAYLLSPQGQAGQAYFRARQLSLRTITHFGLGYAPEGRFALVAHLKEKGFTEHEMYEANAAVRSRSGKLMDRFHGRVMFPILDLRGNVIAFGGRLLGPGEPKYLNTSDTPVFNKGRNLFAMNFAKASGAQELILCEGYMDVIALHQAGFPQAVAGLGTALTPEQARLLARYTGKVIASYDADAAGQKAAARSIPLLRQAGLAVRVLVVPDGKDPDEFIRAHGREGHARFQQLLDNCSNDVAYSLDKARAGCNLQTPQGKLAYSDAAAAVIAALDNEVERDLYVSKVAEEIGVQRGSLLAQVEQLRRKQARGQEKKAFRAFRQQSAGLRDALNPEKAQNLRAARAEENLLACILLYPETAGYILDQLPPENFITAFNRRVYTVIAGKMKDGKAVSLTDLGEALSPEEMAGLAGYRAKRDGLPCTEQELDACIGAIREENDKRRVAQAHNDEDVRQYLQQLRAKKE